MDIEQFLQLRPQWAMEPCVYIVRQMATENPNAHRCGASGTHLFRDADLPYGSENASTTGLLSRLQMYQGFWQPVKGKIFAALRVKRALVAEVDHHRTGEDFRGNIYNIDKGHHTLVLTREREFHSALDARGYRWQADKRNELFVPRRSVQELIATLRTVKGESLYLMFPDGTVVEDEAYRGGSRHMPEAITIQPTAVRQVQDRDARVPSLTIRLSKDSVDQLRATNPNQFAKLMAIVRSYDDELKQTPPPTVMRMKPSDIEKVRRHITKPPKAATPLRRSARFAATH